jgi:predicted small lipoprotein YifL
MKKMKNMRKIVLILTSIALIILSLTACGKSPKVSDTTPSGHEQPEAKSYNV